MHDPRFNEFIKDKVENYPFAPKLMDFCLDRARISTWEEFSKKSQFQINLNEGPFNFCNVIFRQKYARIWLSKNSNSTKDEAVNLLISIFGEEAEITPQQDNKAVGVLIKTDTDFENLLAWLQLENDAFVTRENFEDYILRNNKAGSGKAASYIRALDLLCEMLNEDSFGFDECSVIWNVSSIERLRSLFDLVSEQTSLGSSSKWCNEERRPSSYLIKGFCRAALSEFILFRSFEEEDYKPDPRILCQLGLIYLLEILQKEIDCSDDLFGKQIKTNLFSSLGFKNNNELQLKTDQEILGTINLLQREILPHLESLSRKAPAISYFISSTIWPFEETEKMIETFKVSAGELLSLIESKDNNKLNAQQVIESLRKVYFLHSGRMEKDSIPFDLAKFVTEKIALESLAEKKAYIGPLMWVRHIFINSTGMQWRIRISSTVGRIGKRPLASEFV